MLVDCNIGLHMYDTCSYLPCQCAYRWLWQIIVLSLFCLLPFCMAMALSSGSQPLWLMFVCLCLQSMLVSWGLCTSYTVHCRCVYTVGVWVAEFVSVSRDHLARGQQGERWEWLTVRSLIYLQSIYLYTDTTFAHLHRTESFTYFTYKRTTTLFRSQSWLVESR